MFTLFKVILSIPIKSFGMVSGQGWCIAQIVSLIPNQIGSAAGLIALVFWMWHWVFIRRVNGVLIESSGR